MGLFRRSSRFKGYSRAARVNKRSLLFSNKLPLSLPGRNGEVAEPWRTLAVRVLGIRPVNGMT